MRDPLLHGNHWNAIYIFPIVDLVVREVLIMDESALEGEGTGKD
jgi:hypothetical protein